MGLPVMILGNSGSGKTTSLRNFGDDEYSLIEVEKNNLPFRSSKLFKKTDDMDEINHLLTTAKAKAIVIDDSQYLLANYYIKHCMDKQKFDVFNILAQKFWQLVDTANKLPSDVIVYFLHHSELDANGNIKAKTIGKFLDEKITLEGMFNIVLATSIQDGNFYFRTKTNGNDPIKAPLKMFENDYMDNDLKMVDSIIREYYGI